MKNTLVFVLAIVSVIIFSCKKDENVEIVKMRINHYQQPVNNQELFYGLSYIVQEGDKIGTDDWTRLSSAITGFEYELGYVYDLEIKKTHIESPMIDMPNVVYSLNKVLSKTKATTESTFDITLAISYSNGFESFVTKNEMSRYSLLGKTEIESGDLSSTLEQNIMQQKGMTGTFAHIDNKTIRLVSLRGQ